MCNLPDLIYMVCMSNLSEGYMQNKNVLNYFNDTVVLTPMYLSFLQPDKSFYLSKRLLFDAMLFTISSQSN